MRCHDAFRHLPLIMEKAMTFGEGAPAWKIVHDPATGIVVVQYTAEMFCDERHHIDHMTKVLQQQLRDLQRKIHQL